ncbi:MAG: hypothetical protein IPL46_14035 [Saprospiraceae bacterium]|nr:hypothetical protein [Saprospiraceae bacterium]
MKYLKKIPRYNWDFKVLQETIQYLEEWQLTEMKLIGYDLQGVRNIREVKTIDLGAENSEILKNKYGLSSDGLESFLFKGQFMKMTWPYSRYESPFSLQILSPTLKAINCYLRKNQLPIDRIVIVGTLSRSDLDSKIRRISNGGMIITFNEGVFTLFHTMAKSICLLVPFTKSGNILREIEEMESSIGDRLNEAYGRFSEVLESYINERNANASKIYLQEEKYFDYISAVNQIGPGFMIAHEYGHYFRNHFDKRRSKELELIADKVAFDVTMEGYGDLSISRGLKYLGIEFAILLSQTIQKLQMYVLEQHIQFLMRESKE